MANQLPAVLIDYLFSDSGYVIDSRDTRLTGYYVYIVPDVIIYGMYTSSFRLSHFPFVAKWTCFCLNVI